MLMHTQSQSQKGFAVLEVIIILIVIAAAGFVGYKVLSDKDDSSSADLSNSQQIASESEVKIKHLGINIDDYDPATDMAGDLKFTKFKFPEGSVDTIFLEYGRLEPKNSAKGDADRYNPQPTFLAPLGTKVHALIDGTVIDVPKLYSNDYSVHMQGEGSDYIFETEHVINVLVKKGDKVTAGQVIAEVSDYNGDQLGGLGLFEIGVLVPGNPPQHICTFDFLDDSIKDETLQKITKLENDWETYIGDDNVYQQDQEPIAGCRTRDAVEG